MEFSPVTLEDLFTIIPWRNSCRESLRTGHFTTEAQQRSFYDFLIKNTQKYRFYSGRADGAGDLVSVCGLTDISLENRSAEVSLIVSPDYRKNMESLSKNVGRNSFKFILNEAFNVINLNFVYAECYKCNENIGFWLKMKKEFKCKSVIIPKRKFYNGKYYDSLFLTFFNKKEKK